MGYKTCSLCNKTKHLDDFHKNPNASDGRHSRCADCVNRLAAERRDKSLIAKARKEKSSLAQQGKKQCSKCKKIKSLDEFYSKKGSSDGLKSECKECSLKEKRAKRTAQEKINEIDKRKSDIDSGFKQCTQCKEKKSLSEFIKKGNGFSAFCKVCQAKHSKEWYSGNREKKLSKAKEWVEKNKSRMAELTAKWYRNNPEKVKARNHNRRAREKQADGKFTEKEFKELCQKYENKCLCCGKHGNLTPDHVVPLCKGGKNTIDNIQPLCLTCNLKKARKTIDYR